MTRAERHGALFVVACLAGTLSTLDTTVNIAFPAILDAFHLDVPSLQWIVVTYVLTYAALLLPFGRLADRVGHRTVLLWGLGLSTVALAACGAAVSFPVLLVARVGQGVGMALVLAAAPAIVTLARPEGGQARALAVFQGCMAAGMAIGPPLGGVLLDVADWRFVYFVRVPIAVGLFGLAAALSPRPSAPAANRDTSVLGALDGPGTLAFVAGLSGVLLVASQGSTWGWTSASTLGLLGPALLAIVLFVAIEARARFPLVDLSLFAHPAFSVANALSAIANASMFAIWLLAPTLLVTIRGQGPIAGGLVLAAAPAASALLAPLAGRATTALGPGRLSTVGLVVEALGLAAVSRVGASTSTLGVVAAFALVGAGLGLFQVPNVSYVMGSIPRSQQGVAAGITQMTRTVGVVGGVAAANALFVARSRAHARPPLTTASSTVFVAAFRDVLLGAALLCLAAAVLSLVQPAAADRAGTPSRLRRMVPRRITPPPAPAPAPAPAPPAPGPRRDRAE